MTDNLQVTLFLDGLMSISSFVFYKLVMR